MNRTIDWSALPLGLVSRPYLSRVTGIGQNAIAGAMAARDIRCALSRFACFHCGDSAFAFDHWVEAWGRDRVLAWLDQHDPEGARVLRENIGATEAEVRASIRERRVQRTKEWLQQLPSESRAAMEARHARTKRDKRKPSRRKVRMAEQETTLSAMPVGLLPVLTIAKVAKVSVEVTERYMRAHGIGPYSMSKNSGFPNFAGSWTKLVDAWGVDRARAWVAEHLPHWLAKFDSRDMTGLLPPQYEDALRGAPLGCVPDGVISIAYGVPIYRVSEIRAKRGLSQLRGGTDGAFPHRVGSFNLLVERLGHDRARLWVAGYAPQYLDAFDVDTERTTRTTSIKDTNRKAATTTPAPVATSAPSTKPATGAPSTKSKRGAAARPAIGRSVEIAIAKRAERDGIARDAADRRRPPAPETPAPRPAGRVETIEEFLARGGRVTKLVGAGSANVGQVVA